MREKTWISSWYVVCMHKFALPLTVVRSTSRVVGDSPEGHVPHDQKPHFGDGFSILFFFAVFRGSCLATSNEKPECEKNSGFFMPV